MFYNCGVGEGDFFFPPFTCLMCTRYYYTGCILPGYVGVGMKLILLSAGIAAFLRDGAVCLLLISYLSEGDSASSKPVVDISPVFTSAFLSFCFSGSVLHLV